MTQNDVLDLQRSLIVDCVFKFIDRMNDIAPECGDSAERILNEFVAKMNPLTLRYIDIKWNEIGDE